MNARRNWLALLALATLIGIVESEARTTRYAGYPGMAVGYRTCQIADHPHESLFSSDLAYVYKADISETASAGYLELRGKGNLAYLRWPFGDFDINLDLRGTWIIDSGSPPLPNQLFALRMPVSWIGRYPDGIAARVTLKPGLHGDGESIDGGAFFMPVSVSVIRAFAMDFSGIAGMEYRAGFERAWFPIFGAVWQPHPRFRAEATLPRGGVEWAIAHDWHLKAAYAWESLDYRLHDSRHQLSIEDFRYSLNVTRVIHPDLEFNVEVGSVIGRRQSIRRPRKVRLDPDDALFIRLGVAAPF